MSRLVVLVLALWVVGCAPSGLAPLPADHPASPSAPSAAHRMATLVLPPAPQPDLPAPLRPAGETMTKAGGMHAMHHGSAPRATTPPLAPALDAYLAVQEALAADDLAAAVVRARTLGEALARLTASAPDGAPHFWHARADEVEAVTGHVAALAAAGDLVAARVAFGHVSAALAAWVDVLGVPDGYDVAQFTCGMFRDAPDGGVWLQQGAQVQNPYFGGAMLLCGTREHPAQHGDAADVAGEPAPPHHR